MADKDENRADCDDGCKNGCRRGVGAWGAALAKKTIETEMFPNDDEVQAFIAECKRHGKDPVAVAWAAADTHGIDIANAPQDADKRAVYNLLWKVVRIYGDKADRTQKGLDSVPQTRGGEGFTTENPPSRQCVVTPIIVGHAFSW